MRHPAFLCVLCVLCVESFSAFAQETSPAPVSVRYKCDNKQSLQVDYSTPAGKGPRAVVTAGKPPKPPKGTKAAEPKPSTPVKTSWTMSQALSGSGARYEDVKNKMEWHTKGPEGRLTDLRTNKTITCTEYASSR